MQRIRRLRPSPAMAVALLALFVALGGASFAALKVRSKQIVNGTIVDRDVKRNALTGRAINEAKLGKVPSAGQADVAAAAANANALSGVDIRGFVRYGTSVPQGVTVTGAWGCDDDASGANCVDLVSLPLPASLPLTDTTVNFGSEDTVGADNDDECTGDVANPTAPPGKVCLYTAYVDEGTAGGSGAEGQAIPFGSGPPESRNESRFGFRVVGPANGGNSGGGGVWAYTGL